MSSMIDESPVPENKSNLSSFIDDELNQMNNNTPPSSSSTEPTMLFPLPDEEENKLKKQREQQQQQKKQKSKINEMVQNLTSNSQLQNKFDCVRDKVLSTVNTSQVSQWAQDVIQKGSLYSKKLNHVQPVDSVLSSVRGLVQSYEPIVTEKWNVLESNPLFQKVFIFALLTLSVICPPLAVGVFVFRLCRESNNLVSDSQTQQEQEKERTSKHMTKIVLSSMILCFALCFLLYVPGVLYGWLVLSRFFDESKTVPFWSNEDVTFPWFKLQAAAPVVSTTTENK